MNRQPDIDRILDLWLADGPHEVTDRAFDGLVRRLEHEQQRPAWRSFLGDIHVSNATRLAAALAAVIVIAIAGFVLLARQHPNIVAVSPAPSTTTQPSPSPSASAAPSGSAAADCRQALPVGGAQLDPCSYSVVDFAVPFTLPVDAGWQVLEHTPTALTLGADLGDAPSNIQVQGIGIATLDRVYADRCGIGSSVRYSGKTAKAFWDWLRAKHPMITFAKPTATTLGGSAALQAVDTTKAGQITSACGTSEVPFGDKGQPGNPMILRELGGLDRLTSTVVNGRTVLVYVGVIPNDAASVTPEDTAYFSTFASHADQLLGELRWRSP
jgi:hypothetical protein